METTIYNPQREIVTATLILMLSIMVLTAIRAQGLSNQLEGKDTKTVWSDEKAIKSTDIGLPESAANSNSLAVKIKSWMNSGSYRDNDAEEGTTVSILAHTIAKWMSEGSFWSNTGDMEQQELRLSKKNGMTSDALVMDEK